MSRREAGSAAPTPAEEALRLVRDRSSVRALKALIPYARNSKKHSRAQIQQIKASLMEFGWTRPILMAEDGILAGHGTTTAALELAAEGKCPKGWPDPWSAPVVDLTHLSPAQRRAYVIADNRLAETGDGWDTEMLRLEAIDLKNDGFDIALAGWEDGDLRKLLGDDPTDEGEDDQKDSGATDVDKYLLLIEFRTEEELAAAFDEAKERGWSCKVMS